MAVPVAVPVPVQSVLRGIYDILVQDVQLLSGGVLLEQLGGDSALGGQDDAVLGQNANGGAGMGDGFEGVLDLVETTFGREDGRLG